MTTGPFGTGGFGSIPFSTSPLFNTKTLIDEILRATNHKNPSQETSRRLVVLGFLNNRYARVTSSKHWDWLNGSVDFELFEPYQTGTVSLTQGSESVTGVGTAFNVNVIPDNKLVVGDYVNLITTVNSATGLTLESAFAGVDQSAASYQIIKSIYRLPGDLEHLKSLSIDRYGKLVPIGIQDMRRKQNADPGLTGVPRYYTELFRRPADGVRTMEIFPAPDERMNAHLDYNIQIIKLQDDVSSYPLIPDRHRVVLYYGALADMYQFMKDPTNFGLAEGAFKETYFQMLNDQQLTDSSLIISTARDYRFRRPRRGLRTFMSRSQFSIYD
jgi:hypothetical protein